MNPLLTAEPALAIPVPVGGAADPGIWELRDAELDMVAGGQLTPGGTLPLPGTLPFPPKNPFPTPEVISSSFAAFEATLQEISGRVFFELHP